MGYMNGRMYKCEACGRMEFFPEQNKDGWRYDYTLGDICPECYEEFEKVKQAFLRERRQKEAMKHG